MACSVSGDSSGFPGGSPRRPPLEDLAMVPLALATRRTREALREPEPASVGMSPAWCGVEEVALLLGTDSSLRMVPRTPTRSARSGSWTRRVLGVDELVTTAQQRAFRSSRSMAAHP